jgi:hypothetical protein
MTEPRITTIREALDGCTYHGKQWYEECEECDLRKADADAVDALERELSDTRTENATLADLLDEWMAYGHLSAGGLHGSLRERTRKAIDLALEDAALRAERTP